MALPVTPASAGRVDAPGRQANDCVHPSGISFNELFDVPEQFWNVICTDLSAGEYWRPTVAYDLPGVFRHPAHGPLSPGHHTHEAIWTLSALHCDGVTTDEAASCLHAGENSLFVRLTDVATPEVVNGS